MAFLVVVNEPEGFTENIPKLASQKFDIFSCILYNVFVCLSIFRDPRTYISGNERRK